MKSPNITSTMGRMPVMAAPTPMPAYPGSEIGVSMIRSVPNSCTSPTSVLKGWPASATSSPMTNTRGSRRISSAIASPYVSSRTASGIDVLVDLARLGVWRGQRELHAAVDLRLHVSADPLEDALVGEPMRGEPRGQRVERIVAGHPLALFLLR